MTDTLIIFGAKYLWIVAVLFWGAYFIFTTWRRKQELALLALIIFPFTYIVAKLIGLFYYSARPFVVEKFTPLIPHAADNGFPSDHTLIIAALASVIFFVNRKAGIILFLFALAIGASRIFAGLHHPIDIAGSIIIAAVSAVIVWRILKWIRAQKKKTRD